MASKDNDRSEMVSAYCNDRLSAKEKADFESLLRDNPELMAEVEDFRSFQELYRRIDPDVPPPSEAIFHRISREVGSRQKTGGKAPVRSTSPVESIRSFWQRLRESIAVPWMLAAVQAAVIVLLLVQAPPQQAYSTLSATKAVATIGDKIGINVVFRPNAPEADIRSLLHTVQGSISNGPSREGRYVVVLNNQGEFDKAVKILKQSEIVLFAEPVY